MASGSASTSGRATAPARAIRTLEKSGVPPGRTAGSGTCSLRGPYRVIGRSSTRLVFTQITRRNHEKMEFIHGNESPPLEAACYQLLVFVSILLWSESVPHTKELERHSSPMDA